MDDELLQEFLSECTEGLDRLDQDLVALEDDPADRERLGSIFRTVHTIKGTSGFLAFPTLEKVAHVGENLLVPLRDGEMQFDGDVAGGLLEMVDALRDVLGRIATDGAEGDSDYEPLVERLKGLLDRSADADAVASAPAAAEVEPPPAAAEPDGAAEPPVAEAAAPAEAGAPPPAAVSESRPAAAEPPAAKPAAPAAPAASPTAARSDGREATVRLDVGLLDELMNLVGELVLVRNQILRAGRSSEDAGVVAAAQRLNLITSDLQEGVMKTRMQPVRNAWNKLPRVVRDLAVQCGKEVKVEIEGADTELDKTILEAIKDPLTHIVRNAVDHGIESPEDRVAAGKPSGGTLSLKAFHAGGRVHIEIADDGRGLDRERIRAKAVERGLVTAEEAQRMSDAETTNLILAPGFSTAAAVTNVSGRGVGMDVVKTNVERIGGTLEIDTVPGAGTTLRVRLPLTLAIVPALVVSSAGDTYAIPQVNLSELVRVPAERAAKAIEFVHDVPVLRLRGRLLPLVDLGERLGLRSPDEAHDGDLNVVVLQAEDRSFGLIVDGVEDIQEIVVKPLSEHLEQASVFAGATIMGDGGVALILDAVGLARNANLLTDPRDGVAAPDAGAALDAETVGETEAVLVIDPGDGSRAAVPLAAIDRLEEFAENLVESTPQGDVVQYRGTILPLVGLDGRTAGHPSASGLVRTVVVTRGGRPVGVVVADIVDVVHDVAVTDERRRVIAGRVTELADLDAAAAVVGRLYADQGWPTAA